nr:unnamed protein product [Digitaria exilis]
MDACEIRAPGAVLLRKSELPAEKNYANGHSDAAGRRDASSGTCYSEEATVAECRSGVVPDAGWVTGEEVPVRRTPAGDSVEAVFRWLAAEYPVQDLCPDVAIVCAF